MRNDHLLQIEDVYLQREGCQILRCMHLAVAPKRVFGLIGRNGSGKSSLAYTLIGCAGYAP